MRRLFWLVTLVGCAANQIPDPITQDNAEIAREASVWAGGYGCTQETAGEALVRATNYRLKTGPNKPEIGWDACKLMFANGRPDKEKFQETEDAKYRSWWYNEYSAVHLVTLTLRASEAGTSPSGAPRSPWVVTYVGW